METVSDVGVSYTAIQCIKHMGSLKDTVVWLLKWSIKFSYLSYSAFVISSPDSFLQQNTHVHIQF